MRVLSVQVFFLAANVFGQQQRYPPSSAAAPQTLQLYGTGNQIYSCSGGTWAPVGAEAQLYDQRGATVGHHYFSGGPRFDLDNYGTVIAKKISTQAAPSPGNAPWLKLQALPGSTAPFRFVTRTQTSDGVPSSPGCQGDQQNFQIRYSAVYTFSMN
ncbi:hypothetical protein PGT21_027276 [Puccinia graminis f. sp. tritici]|uniref:DUF3455 domain-containing protein n=1 Tax=Puccinia graminis f. sp. tritici TaxID=56615 RepID=A0A5B0MIB1_PUCGR|nr:hypothetical protein PGTUg99_015084 [Puccinia graminis f. sp. tritici]KAA1091156.1 hypothetical protein PGT21_027276 [Puccinia graminis f. sp. tritici]